jgi:mycofactocin system glycosyltransferase
VAARRVTSSTRRSRARLPAVQIDADVRRAGPDRTLLLGGSPTRLFRLTAAGAALLDRLGEGRAVDASDAQAALVERWIDAGVLHPLPAVGQGPYGAQDVSVVVPVKDDAEGVQRLLASLAEHGVGDGAVTRVIVVDDGSADAAALARVVHHAPLPGVELRRRERSGGPAAARNEGAALVQSPVIVVLDSDCTVTHGWLAPLLAHFADERVAVVAPRVQAAPSSHPHANPVLAAYDLVRSPLDLGPARAEVVPGTRVAYVPSAAFVVRTDRWHTLGGFDPSLRVGEDVDLVWRAHDAGWRVRYEPSAVVHHEVRSTPGAWLAQRCAYGASAAPLEARHPGRLAPAVLSPWSLVVWSLVAVGRPDAALALAFATTVQLDRRLGDVPTAWSLRLGMGGHLAAGRQLAEAVVRVWWPAVAPAALVHRRARRVLLGAAAWSVVSATLQARRRGTPAPGPWPRFAALVLADHAAYGAGVWRGAVRRRSARALLPRLTRARG